MSSILDFFSISPIYTNNNVWDMSVISVLSEYPIKYNPLRIIYRQIIDSYDLLVPDNIKVLLSKIKAHILFVI